MRSHAPRKARPSLVLALALPITLAAFGLPAAAAPDDKPKPAPTAGMGGDSSATMEAYMKLAQPGEHHKLLDRTVGHWTTHLKFWTAPGQPPIEADGTRDASWALGGRYVESVSKGQMMGQAFEGHGTDGYDNASGQYVSTWIDNMGTGILMVNGSADASGKLTVSGDMVDPMSHKKVTYKGVTSSIDADTMLYESFAVTPDGKEFRTMEMISKRVK
jgi:hypothetical protein